MPGLSSGRNDPRDHILGRGVLYFSQHDINSHPTSYRDLGNATAFSITMDATDLEHFSSRRGLALADRKVQLTKSANLAFTLDEWNSDNIALWMSGAISSVSGYSGVAVAAALNGNTTANPSVGRWYDLVKTIASPFPATPFDDRIYDLGVVTVTSTTPATSVEGTTYLVDYKMGRIMFLETTVLTGIAVAANVAGVAPYTEVQMYQGVNLTGSLKFIQVNPANSDQLMEYEIHSTQLISTGEAQLIGDGWSEMQFTGGISKNPAQSAASPYLTVRTFPRAQGSVAD